jgi:hypothetical protein
MNETAVEHRLVAGYLRQFDAAVAVLPVPRARKLRKQIVAHIDEAGGPDASDEEMAAALPSLGLGPARLLVAEAVKASGKRPWAARLGWKGWALIGALQLTVAPSRQARAGTCGSPGSPAAACASSTKRAWIRLSYDSGWAGSPGPSTSSSTKASTSATVDTAPAGRTARRSRAGRRRAVTSVAGLALKRIELAISAQPRRAVGT